MKRGSKAFKSAEKLSSETYVHDIGQCQILNTQLAKKLLLTHVAFGKGNGKRIFGTTGIESHMLVEQWVPVAVMPM